MGIFGTGQAIRRSEDQRFLTGTGRYTGDVVLNIFGNVSRTNQAQKLSFDIATLEKLGLVE